MEQGLLNVSRRISGFLSEKCILSDEEKEIIAYQLRVELSEVILFVVLLFGFMLIDKHWHFAISYLTMRLSRTHIGGLHRKTFWGCVVHTCLFFVGAVLLSIIIPISVPKGTFWILICIDIFFAPCPSIERGNYGRKAKIRMKTLAVAGLILCAVFCMILPRFNNVILITLIMVHVEFMIKYVMERRSLC